MKDTRCFADVEEEQQQYVICFDGVTGKEVPWHAVRKARELIEVFAQIVFELSLNCLSAGRNNN